MPEICFKVVWGWGNGCVGNRIDHGLVIVKVGGWAQETQCIVLSMVHGQNSS